MAVTSAGFERKTEPDIIAEIVAEARATVDPAFDDSPDSVSGQIVGIVGSKHAELYEVLEAVYNALSENSSGVQLDRIAALTGTTRAVGETDAQLRLRRRLELADAGQTTEPAIRAAISKIEGVEAVRVVSNRTLITEPAPSLRPGKSVEVIVHAPDVADATVASAVWANLPAGIQAYGLVPTAITDEEGNAQTVAFSRATWRDLPVRLTVELAPGSYPGDAVLTQTLSDFTSGEQILTLTNGNQIAGRVDIGGVVYRSVLAAAALSVPGVVAVPRVEFFDGGVWRDIDLELLPRELLGSAETGRGLLPASITVVPR
jgi:hypothetical protein